MTDLDIKRVDGAVVGRESRMKIRVGENGRSFLCNGAMAAQAFEFQSYFEMMPGIRVRVVGDGLIAEIMAERKRLGLNDWGE